MESLIHLLTYRGKYLLLTMTVVLIYIIFGANIDSNNNIEYHTITTTTTTPTPPDVLLKLKNVKSNVTIEKYDALRVHTDIMKRKIIRMTQKLPQTIPKKDLPFFNVSNSYLHLFYNKHLTKNIPSIGKQYVQSDISNVSRDYEILQQNVKVLHRIGAGVIFIEYPFFPLSDNVTGEKILQSLFKVSLTHNFKISIILKYYFKRNVLNIRKDIVSFMNKYGNHTGLYRYKMPKNSEALPVFYVMDSYTIPFESWKQILSPTGIITIRNSEYDAIILGHLYDEEHNLHIRKANFDGIFTCCGRNGEYFGSTWKNWESISSWAYSHNILFSVGVMEGSEGVITIKTELNTILRSRIKPTFISFNKIPLKDDALSLIYALNSVIYNSTQQFKGNL